MAFVVTALDLMSKATGNGCFSVHQTFEMHCKADVKKNF